MARVEHGRRHALRGAAGSAMPWCSIELLVLPAPSLSPQTDLFDNADGTDANQRYGMNIVDCGSKFIVELYALRTKSAKEVLMVVSFGVCAAIHLVCCVCCCNAGCGSDCCSNEPRDGSHV